MAKFKVGDKVRVKKHPYDTYGMQNQIGCIGIVVEDDGTNYMQYKLDIGSRSAHWHESILELVSEPKREFIVIRRSGAETIAELRHDREVIKSAKATCAPSDTFDLDTGAKLAFDRLMGREEPKRESLADIFAKLEKPAPQPAPAPEPPKFYTGKVVCIEDNHPEKARRVGTIVEIEDGYATKTIKGFEFGWGIYPQFKSLEHLNSYARYTKWVETKEPSDV